MTFEEWWKTYWKPTTLGGAFDAAVREVAESAWQAATLAEREAISTLLIEAAEVLERTPHGHGQAEHLRTAAACVRAR